MQTFQIASRLNFEEIQTFAAVIELGSFSKAAAALFRTAAAVSYRINSLEASLGVTLLERTTRGVVPTPEGEWLYEKISQLLIWQGRLPEEIKQIQSGVESKFTLVVNNLLYSPQCVATLVAEIARQHPYTQIKVIESVFNGVWDALIYREGSIAIGLPTFHPIDDCYDTIPIGEIRWHLFAAPDHPLTKLASAGRSDLIAYPVINIEDSSLQMKKRLPWRLTGQSEILVPNMTSKIACIAQGTGIGFLPLATAKPLLEAGKLVEIPLKDKVRSSSPMAIGWPRNGCGAITRKLIALFKARDPLIAPFLKNIG